MKIETTVEISKPPSEVYHFLMDEENLRLWVKNFIKLERIQGEDGQVGSTSRHIYDENGKTTEFIEEILVAEEGKLFQAVLRNKQMEVDIINKFSSIDDNVTRLEVTSRLRPQSFISRLSLFFSKKRRYHHQMEDILRLKASIEALGDDFE